MAYLFFQTWVWLLIAFILGVLLGGIFCWICCRNKNTHKNATESSTQRISQPVSIPPIKTQQVRTPEVVKQENTSAKPNFLAEAPENPDDLKRIKGIGAVLEKTLNKLGIYQFKQIAAFSQANIEWIDDHLSFPGRIEREKWVSQAHDLAAGQETEFSKRVDKGDIEY